MVHKPHDKKLYDLTRTARRNGLSYGIIAKKFNLSKSTVSLWCRDIALSTEQQNKLTQNSRWILTLGAKHNHDCRTKEIEKIEKESSREIDKLSIDTFMIAGAMLYWAEGSKSKLLAITNSDEKMIIFFLKWLEKFFKVNIKTDINAHLHIHNQEEDQEIKKYWSKLTGIPLKNFGKSFVKPKGTGRRKNILSHGIIRIRLVGKGSTDKRIKIMSWVEKTYQLAIKIK